MSEQRHILLRWVRELETARARILDIVREQAEDEGLWFDAVTVPEGYLQAELRRLHRAIEDAYGR